MKLKYIKYLWNVFKSYFYDAWFFLITNWRERILADDYAKYIKFRSYPYYLKVGGAMECIKYLAEKYCKGSGLDIGAGVWPLKNARPVEDNSVENAYNLKAENNSVDFVFSSHLFEHLEHPYKAVDEWHRVVKENGIIFFYIPHPSCKMWHKEVLSCHEWNPTPLELDEKFSNDPRFKVEKITYQPDAYMSYVLVLKKIS